MSTHVIQPHENLGVKDLEIVLSNGIRLPCSINTTRAPDDRAFFLMGIRKSGSTLLADLASGLAEETGYGYLDAGSMIFYKNVMGDAFINEPPLAEAILPGVIYSGFRDCPFVFRGNDIYERSPKIFLVRDPRDALISEYFSNAYSHDLPNVADSEDHNLMTELRLQALKSDIENYVLHRASHFLMTATFFMKEIVRTKMRVYKYEDMIFEKEAFLRDLCYYLDINVSSDAIAAIASANDIRPEQERPQSFVRRVSPGDHKEKLSPQTIDTLNIFLSPMLEFFNYR